MNHIYKVIFNKATGTFMAVAEYAKSHSTGGSCATGQVGSVCTLSFARIAALAVLVIGATLNGSAYASVAIGGENGQKGSAEATGNQSVAIGENAQAKNDQTIAIGGSQNKSNNIKVSGATAQGKESIAIGGDVLAEGHASIALGSDDLYLNENNNSSWVKGLIQRHPELSRLQTTQSNSGRFQHTHAKGHASIAVGTMSYARGHFPTPLVHGHTL